MGLCLSKRDVLIQKPQLSLREQMMLNSDLQFRTHHLFIPDSPSASMVSGDTSSSMAAEKQLLKNNSIGSSCTLLRSSVSNVAECGSRSSFGDWRFGNRGGPLVPPSDDELDELSSTCPRTSGFSYLSSPMIEGIESYGLDNIARSYHKAKERFELDGFSNFNTTKLLEIDEEREDEETGEESPGVRKRKSHTKSLHVFGDVGVRLVPDIKTSVCNNTQSKMRSSSGIGVFEFGAGDQQLGLRSKASQPVFKQSQLDSDFSCSEVESEAMHVRSARWGFVLDSSGTDEMEGEETEASRVSSSSTQIESLCKSSPGRGYSKFMAVPPRSEIWPPNFSHMNPAGNSRPGGAIHHTNTSASFTGFPSGVSSAQGFVLKPISLDSSSSLSSEESQRTLKQVHLNLNSNSNSNLSGAKLSSDDGSESDTSDDLFEIDNLGAALGSLSSATKGFACPMNSAFLQDPDISYSTVRVAPGPGRGFPFQAHHKASSLTSGGKILGPTLRANVLASASSKIHKPGEQPRKVRQMKKKTTAAVENGMFYGR